MGHWGTGISSNDTFEGIKDEFFEFYNEGLEPTEIAQKLISSNQEIINEREDRHNFWFALALCQWECKALEPELLEKITKIVESGKDIELRKELGAEKSELTKRKKVLDKFLEKLNSEKKSPKKRKKKVLRDAIFKKGDCLSVQLSNGLFGAAFVLEAEEQTEYGLNLIALCEYYFIEPPTAQYFEKAYILITKSPYTFEDYPLIGWSMASHFNAKEMNFTVVENLKAEKNYNRELDYSTYIHWNHIPTHIQQQPENVAKHGAIHMKVKLNSLRLKK
jgi:hypothetical protein